MKVLETSRLYLRETVVEDAETIYLLNLDPQVIQYTGDKAFGSVEEAREFIKNYDHYKKYGFGRWAVIRKSDEVFLGWCGLKYTAELNEYDIGFRFFKEHWNKGYATEATKACLDLGFNKFKIQKIVGRAMTQNAASIRVLEKIGLNYLKPRSCGGEEGVVYTMER